MQTAGPGAGQSHWAAVPVCTIQHDAAAWLRKLSRSARLRDSASLRTNWMSEASRVALPSRRLVSTKAAMLGTAVAARIARTTMTIASSSKLKPCCRCPVERFVSMRSTVETR
jgi:hypothetical protein